MSNFISDEKVERELDFLHDQAPKGAMARANRVYVIEYRKTLKAQIMAEYPELSAVLQEREAYRDKRYIAHLEAIREAIYEDEKYQWLKGAADATIGAWRTLNANIRGMTI